MKSLLELYGQQFRNPMPNSDSEDYTTADVFGQMGANKRRAEYDNSLLGMVHNWATGEQRQPVQLPDNAPLMDQMKEAGMRMLNLPNDMAAGGAKTMAHWLGSAGNPEMVEPLDMLAPLGIGAIAWLAGAVPRGAVGSAGGRLPTSPAERVEMLAKNRMERGMASVNGDAATADALRQQRKAIEMHPLAGYDDMNPVLRGSNADGKAIVEGGTAAGNNQLFGPGKWVFYADQSRASLPGLAANALDIKHDVELKRIPFGGRDHVTAGVGDSMFEAAWDGDTLRVFGGRVVDDQRGAGVGTSIYHALANEAFSKGGKLASDAAVSAAAQRIYAGFSKRGFDVQQSPAAKPGKGGGGSLVTDDGSPVFTVGPSGDRNSGTPGTDDRLNKIFSDQSRSSIPGLLAGAADEPKGITAYHGSPHDFDRFSMDKIGTGEGAQAYGHGLYFAENEGVAGAYKKQLTDRTNFVRPDGSLWSADGLEHMNVRAMAYRGDIDGAIAKARVIAAEGSPVAGHARRDLEKLLSLQASGGVKPNPGRMYEVRINADPEDFLDWDKPLSQQSKPVRDAVKELRPDEQTVRMISDLEAKEASGAGNYASRMLLARLKKRFGSHAVEQDVRGSSIMSDERAAALLRDSGIPGIRYLDQGSRGAGEGSRNYVLFRDDIIEIVKKYGIAAAASMYGMSQVQDAMASEGP